MALCIYRNLHLTPSLEPPVVGCWKTSKRRDFYKVLDKNGISKSLTIICIDVGISQPMGIRWKKLRENIDSQAVRTTKSTSTKLRRPSKVTKQIYKDLINSKKNYLRFEAYEVIIEEFQLPVQKRQLVRKLKEYTRGSRRYRYMFIKKQISSANRDQREDYSWRYKDYIVDDYWLFIAFIDEVYIDPSLQGVDNVL